MEEVMSFRISLKGQICCLAERLFDFQKEYCTVVLNITWVTNTNYSRWWRRHCFWRLELVRWLSSTHKTRPCDGYQVCLLREPASIIKFPSNEVVAFTSRAASPLPRYMCNGYHTQLIPFEETTSAPSNEPECLRDRQGITSKQDAGRLLHLSIFMCGLYLKNVIYWPCISKRYITIYTRRVKKRPNFYYTDFIVHFTAF
jgi:hypothetical protein